MTDAPPPGVTTRRSCKRVKALLRSVKGWPLPHSRLQLTPAPAIHLPIRISPLPEPISSSCGSPGAVSGRSRPSAPCSGHMRLRLPGIPLQKSPERMGAPTCPRSCNPEQGQVMPEPHEPYPDLESSPFPVSSCALVSESVPVF